MTKRIEKITEHIDHDGVITRSAEIININKLPPEPAYIKLYIADIGRMYSLRPAHQNILLHLAACAGWDGIITLSSRKKMAIALSAQCSPGTVDNALVELTRLSIIRRAGRGEYELDPRLFGKGDWKEIRERRLSFVTAIKYSPDGTRAIEGVVARKE